MSYVHIKPSKSKIEWTDYTINPWSGCRKVSKGCKFCYMHRIMDNDNPNDVRQNFGYKWKLKQVPSGSKVFYCSISDFFIEEADPWRSEVWDLIRERQDLIFQLLTKRVDRIARFLPDVWGTGYPNVWLGVSIEDQEAAERMVTLASLKNEYSTNKIWLSLEPLLGPINLFEYEEAFEKIDWVVIGGESGNDYGKHRYRECRLDWMYNLLLQCDLMEVPVFVKQLGTYLGKALANGHSHGGNQKRFPKSLQRFEFPN